MRISEASDQVLLCALRAGEHDALTEIFRRHWKQLYLTACHKLQSHDIAEEVVQELFTDLWDKREKLFNKADSSFHFGSYLNRAVKNKILNHIRRLVYDKKYWAYCREHLPASESSTHQLAEYNDLQGKLDDALNHLSAQTKEIFVLHKIKGVPVIQISRDLKLSEKAVGYHLTKSVKELKVHLRDFI